MGIGWYFLFQWYGMDKVIINESFLYSFMILSVVSSNLRNMRNDDFHAPYRFSYSLK